MENKLLEDMEYIGDIPEGWKWVKLGEIAEIKTGKTNSQDSDEMGNYPLFDRSRVIKRSKKFLFDTEAVIIPGEGKEFIPRYYNGKFDLHQRTYAIFNFKKSIPKFIYYNILLNKDILKYFATGSTVLSLRLEHFLNFPIILPPIEEQKAIVDVLSSIDDKIELLHRQNKTLEEMAMTLFRQWFIESTKNGLPDGWEEVSLGEFIKEVLSGDWGKDKPEGEYKVAVNCIRGTDISDLQNGLPKKTPVRFLKESKFKLIEPKDGDIIIEISGGTEDQSTGRAIYINSLNRQLFEYPIVFSNFCRLLRPKENFYTYFLYLYLKYLYMNDELFSLENGTSGIKNLDYKALLYDLKYPMPKNTEIYLSFYENVSILFEKIDKNKLQIQTLEKLRDTLLPKLMSGEIRVKI